MSSPRGLFEGGMEGMGIADEERFPRRVGDGVRGDDGVAEEEGAGRARRKDSGLSMEARGAARMLRYMLKLRSARFACGT